jgi:hypothetical protein
VVGLARIGDQPVRPRDAGQCDDAVERLDEVREDAILGEAERAGVETRELGRQLERRQALLLVEKL